MNEHDDLIGVSPNRDPDGLTTSERVFVETYCAKSNANKAAMAAGYTFETAAEMAKVLLARPRVAMAVTIRQKDMIDRYTISAENVAREYAHIAFSDPRALFDDTGKPIPPHQLSNAAASAIAGFEVNETEVNGAILNRTYKYKQADKLKALDALANILGMRVEKLELTGKDGEPLMGEVTDLEKARRVAYMLHQVLEAQSQNKIVDMPENEE